MAVNSFKHGQTYFVRGEGVRYNGKLVRRWETREHPWSSALGGPDLDVTVTRTLFLVPERASRDAIIRASQEREMELGDYS